MAKTPSPALRAPSPPEGARGKKKPRFETGMDALSRQDQLFTAPAPGGVPGLASIIVPCFNQLEFTRHCLQALIRHTRQPWELIVVDNGSTDGTAAYLAGVQDLSAVPVTAITNARNLGFPAAVNQGLEVAQGEFFVLLNNDAVVTDAWLDHLIALTTADPTIGLTGPMSNYAPPPQLVEEVPYRDLEEMQVFARRWRDEHGGKWFTVGKLSGFCLLMTRAVHDKVGGLDERFGIGFFDDDDLAERARRAGLQLAVAHDLFVHHFGSRTFAGNGIDAEALLEENARRFADKWGQGRLVGRRVELRPWSHQGHPQMKGNGSREEIAPLTNDLGGEHRLERRTKVSLTQIVRDEEFNLPRCLESVRGLFDEIVVVDTGSTDRTKEIAADFGARVFDFAWIDDFSAARNAALSHATGDYAFWLDADDVVDPPERAKLRTLLDSLDALADGEPNDQEAGMELCPPGATFSSVAYVVRCACDPSADGSGGQTVVDHIRLFPLRDDVRWTYRVHEQILPALQQAEIPVRWSDLVVRHTGYTDLELRAKKLVRDARLARLNLEERPGDPFILFNLGAIAIERQDWPGAMELLRRSLVRSAPRDSITGKIFALIARAHQMQGDTDRALRVCDEGLSIDPEDAELWFRKAVVHRQRGESARAEACWRRILGLKRPERYASVDMGIYGHLTRRNLAVLAAEPGDHAEAARLWAEVLAECPGDREALAHLGPLNAAHPAVGR